jgi:hypothetical protein
MAGRVYSGFNALSAFSSETKIADEIKSCLLNEIALEMIDPMRGLHWMKIT